MRMRVIRISYRIDHFALVDEGRGLAAGKGRRVSLRQVTGHDAEARGRVGVRWVEDPCQGRLLLEFVVGAV